METSTWPRCARDKPHADVASIAHLFPPRERGIARPGLLRRNRSDRQPDIQETAVTPGWKDELLPARSNTWATETHHGHFKIIYGAAADGL